MTETERERFRSVILGYYRRHPRDFPWRRTRDPYRILVSEIMLQQTQTSRVLPKYEEFLATFPTVGSLATASLAEVLRLWQGLGYNRRAKFLKSCAEYVASKLDEVFPAEREALRNLPGIGVYTSGAICAFAYGLPVAFIETNIRRVFLHFFFPDRDGVTDREILPLVEETVVESDPRTWYYALMDYGVMLASRFPNPNRRSAHYVRQSRFENSNRQIRGRILRLLSEGARPVTTLTDALAFDENRVAQSLEGLIDEGMVVREGEYLFLPGDGP